MPNIFRIMDGVDVARLNLEVDANPDLWDSDTIRTADDNGPFSGTSDLWLRYRAKEELTSPEKYKEPHFAVWYPAVDKFPSVKPIVRELMTRTGATHLGGVMLTRIPAGKAIKPHDDRGSWHAEFMNCKVYLPVKTNVRCYNWVEDDEVVMRVGEAWYFNNLVTHSVENMGNSERVTLIVCMRVEN